MELRHFEVVRPPHHLRPFVRRYLYSNRLLQSDLTYHARPTGYAYFCNFFGANHGDHGAIDDRPFRRASRWFIFGQITGHEAYAYHPRVLQLLVAELTPTGHHRLFGIQGTRILGLAADLGQVAPERARLARDCFVLRADASRDEHIAEANRFFSGLAQGALSADAMVEEAVRHLEAENGAMRIADLSARLGTTPRELNRRFSRIVGMSPKFFGQVMQINWVVGLLYSGDRGKLAEIALDAGFYDQAHFNRAMKRFFREGPREFLRSDRPGFRTFLAAARLSL